MSKLLISYRRADTAAIAGRIRDRLARHFGEDRIYMDIDAIPIGVDFRTHLGRAVANADAVLVLMGEDWAGARGDGTSRIMEEQDPIRMEVESAFQSNRLVIPVLIDRAVMPVESGLPKAMAGLAYLNAAHVDSGRDFNSHMERLIQGLEASIGPAAASGPAAAAPVAPSRPGYRMQAMVIAGVLVAGLAAAAIVFLPSGGSGDAATAQSQPGHRDEILKRCVANPTPGLDCACFATALSAKLTPPQQLVLLTAMENGSTIESTQKAMDAQGITDPNFRVTLVAIVAEAAQSCMPKPATP